MEGVEAIMAESMRNAVFAHDYACFSCPLPCSKVSFICDGPVFFLDTQAYFHLYSLLQKGTSYQTSISVPIKSYICPVALSVLGPDNRFVLKVMMDVLREMKRSAALISRKLMQANQRGQGK